MHPQRWGDPDAVAALPEGARSLVEAVFGPATPAEPVSGTLPAPALPADLLAALADAVGEAYVSTDDDLRRHRTRGKSTPDLLRARAGDLTDAPDAVVRPGSHDEVAAVLALAVEHHAAVVPFGGGTCVTGGLAARRDGYSGVDQPRPRPADRGLRRPGLDDRRPRSRPPRPRGRGRPGRARRHAGPLPAVVRARLHRRLRRDPVERPGVGGVRTFRRAGRRPHRRHPDRHDDPRLRAGHRRRPRPAAAGARLRRGLRRDHLGDGAGPAGAGGEGLRGLALADLRRGGRRRAGDRPVRAPADGAPALRRGRVRRQPGRPERDREQWRRLPDGRRLRGARRPGGRAPGRRHRAAHRARRGPRRRGARPRVGARPLPGAVPARLPARPRRAGRDAGDGDLLVGRRGPVRGGEGRARGRARP